MAKPSKKAGEKIPTKKQKANDVSREREFPILQRVKQVTAAGFSPRTALILNFRILILHCPNVVIFPCLLPFLLHVFPTTVYVPCCLMFRLWKAFCLPWGCILLYSHIAQVFPLAAFPSRGGTQNSVGKAPCRRSRDLHYFDRSSGTAKLQLGGGRAQLIKSLRGRMWINVIWEMLPCDHCTASPDLLLSVQQSGLLLLPDIPTGSSASHFSLRLSFLLTIQSETHILILKEPYRHVLCFPSCSRRDGDALHAVLWKFLLEWPEKTICSSLPKGMLLACEA